MLDVIAIQFKVYKYVALMTFTFEVMAIK